jgi:hypothetical protein
MATNHQIKSKVHSIDESPAVSKNQCRIYVISPYFPDNAGRLLPELPTVGPCRDWNEQACHICFDHDRDRKTGPDFPLHIARCVTHKKGFTIYPPGYVPYGRQRLAPVAPDGSLAANTRGAQSFADTCFDAALDAAQQRAWPHESIEGNLMPRFPAQMRHLTHCSLLLGIQPGLHRQLREEIAQILCVGGQRLYDSATRIETQPGYFGLGKAICSVLDALEPTTSLFERLAEAGAGICLWPTPQLWDPQLKTLRRSQFHRIRTRSPPG